MRRILPVLLVAFGLFSPSRAQESRDNDLLNSISVFCDIYKELELSYVDTLNCRKMLKTAYQALLSQTDPYTVYYPQGEDDELQQMKTGKYAGIGASVIPRPDLGRCVLGYLYPNQPAAESGLHPGDIIMAINDYDPGDMEGKDMQAYTSDISAHLRGNAGSALELVVKRNGISRPLRFPIRRRLIAVPAVSASQMVNGTMGYIRLDSYIDNAAHEMRVAVENLKKAGAKSLILDLRDNVGGILGEAVKTVSLFLPQGKEVAAVKGRASESDFTYSTETEPIDTLMPLVVLVNGNTASAAEITAGTLQDYDRAVLIGTRTYGKGLVQETHEIPHGGTLKITTSKYYIPSGRCVQAYRFENGEPVALPDSLAQTFHTRSGRPVKDAGGVTPDIRISADTFPHLLYELAESNQLFDYCVNYRNTHRSIAPSSDFRLTEKEYEDFCEWLKKKNFTYDRMSLRVLEGLRKVAEREGYAESAKKELDALEAKLSHNEAYDFKLHEKEIRRIVEQMIVSSYYYDAGVAEYNMRGDKVFQKAVEVLSDSGLYRSLLTPPAVSHH